MIDKDKLANPRRRWLRFNLRTFLIVLTILCVWLSWYSIRAKQQREAVIWVLKNGGTVEYDYEYEGQKFIHDSQPSAPKLLLDLLGVDYFSAVTRVEFNNSQKQVSDVTPLASLTKLEDLELSDTQVSDLAPLADLTNLKKLRLSITQVSDVRPLAGLANLETLMLLQTQVSDLTPLAGLTSLETLVLTDTQVSDVRPLAGLANLETLMLSDTQVIDVTPLAGLANLGTLWLSGTQVSDVTPLSGLANLKDLDLSNTQVSEEDLEKLKQALPNCFIGSISDFP